MDEPDMIVKGALTEHYQMVKQMKGVPGVKPERFLEAMQVGRLECLSCVAACLHLL